MRKLFSFAVVCALCGFAVACGDNGTDPDPDVVIVLDSGEDANTPDVVVNPDADRDEGTDPDEGTNPDEGNNPDEGGLDVCTPVCTPNTCVDDGCGNPCPCNNGYTCNAGVCEEVVPCNDGVGSCKWYWDECYSACPNPQTAEGEACVAECQGQLTAEGQADLQTFNNCIYNICGSATTQEAWYACIDENCTEAIIGCYWGCTYLTCAEMYGCFDGCPDDDPGTTDNETSICYGDCRNESSEQAQLDQNDMYNCAFDECPICETYETAAEEEQCNECFNDAVMGECWDFYKNCVAGGDKYPTCVEFTICFTTCQYTAQTQAAYDACVDECQAGVTPDGLRDRIMAEECSLDACPVCQIDEPTEAENEQCNTCWGESMYGTDGVGVCDAEWSKCAGTDNATCMDYYACSGTCQDYACVAECRGNTTLAGMKDMMAASECSLTACPVCEIEEPTQAESDQCDQCWAASQTGDCADEWSVCLPHGDDTCEEVFTCVWQGTCEDSACVQACINAGTLADQETYIALHNCMVDTCAEAADFGACVETAINAGGDCADEYGACVPA